MKIKKGNAGYIHSHKTKIIIKTLVQFGIVAALLVLGIMQTGDRLNLLTVVAILGCLPASKSLVEVIMLVPHQSIKEEQAIETLSKSESLTSVFDLVFTSEKKVMPVDSIVISDNTICGYSSSLKVNTSEVSEHIKKYLHINKFTKVSVKIFDNYTIFLNRADDMNMIASVEKEVKEKEAGIRQVILNISL
jgi:hypothetical protein